MNKFTAGLLTGLLTLTIATWVIAGFLGALWVAIRFAPAIINNLYVIAILSILAATGAVYKFKVMHALTSDRKEC